MSSELQSTVLRPSLRYGFLFGSLSMLGPFGIDFYLPAFPSIAAEFGVSPGWVQVSLAAYIVALACGPLVFGALSDRHGRRPILFTAMSVFGVTSVLCASAPSIYTLIGLRMLQGLGAAGITVMSRAMVRDIARDYAASKLLAQAFLVQSVSPLLAPILGGSLLAVVSWRTLFLIIAGMTVAVGILAWRALPETHTQAARRGQDMTARQAYCGLLGNRRYLGMCLIAGCATAGGFGFLTVASFIFADGFAMDHRMIGVALAGLSLSHVIAIQCSPFLVKRYGIDRLLGVASGVSLTGAAALALLCLLGLASLTPLMGLIAVLFASYGVLLSPACVGALDAAKHNGGAAAALLGTLQLLMAASASTTLSIFTKGAALPFSILAVTVGLLALLCLRVVSTGTPEHKPGDPLLQKGDFHDSSTSN